MYTQALNSGGGVAQRLNYPFSFLIQRDVWAFRTGRAS